MVKVLVQMMICNTHLNQLYGVGSDEYLIAVQFQMYNH